MNNFLEGIQECIDKATKILEIDQSKTDEYEVMMWKQTWGDTSCGFGGIGGQMITSAYTVAIVDSSFSKCIVFHDMRLAYETEVTKDVLTQINRKSLIGAMEYNNNKNYFNSY